MLIPRITKADNSIVKQMYSEWFILRCVTPEYMYWDRNEQVVIDEENLEKQAMYDKMAELKQDPVKWKELEEEAFSLLTPTQQKSEAWRVHRDTKVRQLILDRLDKRWGLL